MYLHCAAQKGNFELVTLLVEKGANILARDIVFIEYE